MIRVERIQIPTLPTKKPRRLYIYTPKGYERSEERYPVLYMFDGHNVFYDSHATYGKSWGMKEYLEKTKLPLIVVAVACNPEGNRRIFEYSPWDFQAGRFGEIRGQGRETMEWFTGTLKPEIDRTWRTLPDREHCFIAGSSLGGLMALWAVLAYNEVFSGAAALSPSLWVAPKQITALIQSRSLADPTRIYLDVGDAEAPPSKRDAVLGRLFRTAGELSKAGADTLCRAVPGAVHNEAAWEKRIPQFMDHLLRESDQSAEP